MDEIPTTLRSLLQQEEGLRSASESLITTDEGSELCVRLVACAMDVLYVLSDSRDLDDTDDRRAVQLLSMRLFNRCAACYGLIARGYYQVALMTMRDILEVVFLLDFFHSDRKQIAVWRAADEVTRKSKFSAVKVRTARDKRDGYVLRKREAAYSMYCELASHPTMKGFSMLRPRQGGHQSAPFVDSTWLRENLEELAIVTLQATQIVVLFFPDGPCESEDPRQRFVTIVREWIEYFLPEGMWPVAMRP